MSSNVIPYPFNGLTTTPHRGGDRGGISEEHWDFKSYLATPYSAGWTGGRIASHMDKYDSSVMPLPVIGVPAIVQESFPVMQPKDLCSVRFYVESSHSWGKTVQAVVVEEVMSTRANGPDIQTYLVYVPSWSYRLKFQVVPYLGEVWPYPGGQISTPYPKAGPPPNITPDDHVRRLEALVTTGNTVENISVMYTAVIDRFVQVPYPVELRVANGPYRGRKFRSYSVLPWNQDTANAIRRRGYMIYNSNDRRCTFAPCQVMNGPGPIPLQD